MYNILRLYYIYFKKVLEVIVIRYSNNIYYKYLKSANLHGAIDYLEKNNKYKLVKKYKKLFENKEWLAISDNKLINDIGLFYQEYYRDIFWLQLSNIRCEKKLINKFIIYFKLSQSYNYSVQQIENIIKKQVENQGYFYVGDYTSGYLGPYIWKSNKINKHLIKLPFEEIQVNVNMMENFVMKSWLSFLSFDVISTGGWVTGYEKKIFCVKDTYDKYIDSPIFYVSLLKHEAQHICDRRNYKRMCSKDLEYRAKLVELIYYPNIKKFIEFFYEASDNDKKNTHCYASFVVISKLSKKIYNIDYQSNLKKWLSKFKLIRKYSLDLLKEHTIVCEKFKKSIIDII